MTVIRVRLNSCTSVVKLFEESVKCKQVRHVVDLKVQKRKSQPIERRSFVFSAQIDLPRH